MTLPHCVIHQTYSILILVVGVFNPVWEFKVSLGFTTLLSDLGIIGRVLL